MPPLDIQEEEILLEQNIRLIEKLHYDAEMDSMESDWVRSVLTESSSSRHKLLVWVLSQLCPADASDLQSSLKETHSQKILQSFASLGICKTGDSGLIEGTAPPLDQLKFWRGCLEKVWQVHHVSNLGYLQKDSITSDRLLDHLTNSNHLSVIMKETGANVIPGHLREKYRLSHKYLKNIPYDEVRLDAEEKLRGLQEQYSNVDKRWKNSPPITSDTSGANHQLTLCESISSLIKGQELFQGVNSLYISPWTKSTSQLDLPDTGVTVHEASTKLSNVLEVLNSMGEVSQKCWELTEQGKQMAKHRNRPSTIMAMLQGIVAHEQNPKLPVVTKN